MSRAERGLHWPWTCDANGSPARTTASVVLGGTRIQERTRSTTNELELHSQQRPRQKMRLSWEEAELAALDRHEWHRSEAQCVHMDAGRIEVMVKVKEFGLPDFSLFLSHFSQ